MVERITVEEFHARLKAQGVPALMHAALVCPICRTVQSIASLRRAGASEDHAERMIGFACEGRLTDAGPYPAASDKSRKAQARRNKRGCDWTLGGLFKLHELEVETPDGEVHPRFQVASRDEASALLVTVEAA